MRTRVGIVGHRGYSGAELLHILHRHPSVAPVLLEHREDGNAGTRFRLGGKVVPRVPSNPASVQSEDLKAILLATPPEVSMELAPGFLQAGAKVVDLSGAFRLQTPERYQRWYKEQHTEPELLKEAAYGLPEFCREKTRGARLVCKPGLLSDRC